MSPRPYNLGARAASVEETRRRILDAALEEFADNEAGVDGTSMAAIARRADVAPGTVRYHFDDVDEILGEVIERWMVEFEMPSPEDIDPTAPLSQRFATLVSLLYRVFARSEDAYQIWRKSPEHPIFEAYAARFYGTVGEMMGRALGDAAADPETMAVVSVLVDPGFRGTLVSRGLSAERAADITAELGLGWLEGRS